MIDPRTWKTMNSKTAVFQSWALAEKLYLFQGGTDHQHCSTHSAQHSKVHARSGVHGLGAERHMTLQGKHASAAPLLTLNFPHLFSRKRRSWNQVHWPPCTHDFLKCSLSSQTNFAAKILLPWSASGGCAFGSVLVNGWINQKTCLLRWGSRLCPRYVSLTLFRGSHWPQQQRFLLWQKGYLELAFTIGTWDGGIALKLVKRWGKACKEKSAYPVYLWTGAARPVANSRYFWQAQYGLCQYNAISCYISRQKCCHRQYFSADLLLRSHLVTVCLIAR